MSMEASKCPKCGEEPSFLEHLEKWYCYGCNSYVDEEHPVEQAHADEPVLEKKAAEIAQELKSLEDEDLPTCTKCGATMEEIKDGKLYCFICESYPSENPSQPIETPEPNEAQSLLDQAGGPSVEESASEIVEPVVEVKWEVEDQAPKEEPVKEIPPIQRPEPAKEKAPEIKMCSACEQPMKWIDKYQRYYCYGCRKYAPKEGAEKHMPVPALAPVAQAKHVEHDHKECPECNKELKFIEKYCEYYCYSCKKYPLREKKKAAEQKPAPSKPDIRSCPKCGDPLKFIEKYQRHYCYTCKEYAPKGTGGDGNGEKKECPVCHESMKFVSEYNEWYCLKCKKYSLRPAKPMMLVTL